MPFSPDVKTQMFVACARVCPICFKICGKKIEAHHIIQEAEGGPNTFQNGVPVCFDCHEELGSYNAKHPKGNRFRPAEVRKRRDALYALVETGKLQTQVVLAQLHQGRVSGNDELPTLPDSVVGKTKLADGLLEKLLENPYGDAAAKKLKLLPEVSRAYILDALLDRCASEAAAMTALGYLSRSPAIESAQREAMTEAAVRNATLLGETSTKVALLTSFSPNLIASIEASIREAFIDDLLDIVDADQFDEVNSLVPAMHEVPEWVPPNCHARLTKVMLRQSGSSSFHGAPAARSLLRELDVAVAVPWLETIEPSDMFHTLRTDVGSRLIDRCINDVTPARSVILRDFRTMKALDFLQKHARDDD